jgi:hypothetical protein
MSSMTIAFILGMVIAYLLGWVGKSRVQKTC